jgi:hypothetical protein
MKEGPTMDQRRGEPKPLEMTPELAEHFDKLRHAREAVNPFGVYTLQWPDGSSYSATGADLIATAEASVRCVDAIERGEDPRVIMAAFDRLDKTMEDGTPEAR